ncbi:MAG: hypothetical protein WCK77_01770 [Verrucomicrobiota bacterium]
MQPWFRLVMISASLLAHFTPTAVAQDAPQLALEMQAGRRLVLRWQATAGTTQLVWSDTLGNASGWQPLAGAQPLGGDAWQAEFQATPPRAFFRLQAPGLPVAPPNPRLVMVGDHFQLEWDSTSDAAGYVVYVGLSPDVGPVNSLLRLVVPLANAVEIQGLTAGGTYFITVAATNGAGEGPPAAPVSGVFGPKGVLAGTAVQSFQLSSGEAFDVVAEGAGITLIAAANPKAQARAATADDNGQVRFANLPAGDYLIGYGFQGQTGVLKTPVTVPEGGVAIMPIRLPGGTSTPGATLVGTLALADGSPARNDIEEFGIHVEAQLRAVLASGTERAIRPNRSGAWALTGLTSADYPLSLVMDYQGLHQRVTAVTAAPSKLARIDLRFAETLPTVKRVTFFQNGKEVQSITPGVPVTVSGEIDNPDGLALEPRWIAEFNGEKQLATGTAPVFVFNQPPGPDAPGSGDVLDGGMVRVRFIPAPIDIGPYFGIAIAEGGGATIAGVGCWSGLVGQWSPYGPDVIAGALPATITVTHSGPLSPSSTTTINNNAGGYFELPVDPTSVPPYLVRVDKPGFMRFLWPFESRLPTEATYCVTATTTSYQSQNPSGPRVFTHPLGGTVTIPWGEVIDPLNQHWYGDIIVTMTTFDPTVRHPLPPGAEVRGTNLRNGILAYGGVWFEITDYVGVPLMPTAACTLTLKVPASVPGTTLPGYHQVETTGYFERWGYGAGTDAQKTGTGQFTISLGTKGLFLVGYDWPLVEMFIDNDRTLGYPFDVLVGKSIFPVTAQGYHQVNTGHLFAPSQAVTELNVLDLRHAPGLYYPNPATPTYYLSPMQKTPVVTKSFLPNPAIPALPAIATYAAAVSLKDSEPKLTTVAPGSAVLNNPTQFLSRGGVNSAADAQDYYTRINAPATLAQWRTLNGFPARFGGPLAGVSADDYATAYYHNLGDLGFARAQTMRVKFSAFDAGYDTAYAVTNYGSLDDAICGRGAVATVCMDFAKRNDTGALSPTRYTRFYVYGSNGLLLKQADLDGAGLKGVPNLCVTCHGGNFYDGSDPGRTPNLGSRFLPFDLESYTYHPKFGVPQAELARMNKGVLLTGPTAATADLIAGWYGTPNPLTNLYAFNQNYVPTTGALSWAANPGLYSNVFKGACRVCHNSRETTGYVQFASLSALQASGFGNYPVGSSLQMPHAQRPWGIFWGSRAAANLGHPVTDMPTVLQLLGGTLYR